MKKTKRLLSLILAFVMLASCAVFSAQAASNPQYDIDFVYDVDAETATATISITGDSYRVGRFGFGYNTEALVLVNKDGDVYENTMNMADVVIGAEVEDTYTIITTEETNLISDLVNTEDGVIMFAWYANHRIVDGVDLGYVDAEDGAVIATVNFVLTEELANAENPAVALNAVKDEIVFPVDDEVITENIKGWNDVYVASDLELVKNVSDKDDVDTSVKYTAALDDITATATSTTVTVRWEAEDAEVEGSDIGSYVVVVTDSDGNVIATKTVEAIEDNLDRNGRYTVEFNSNDDGIEKNKTYTITVTPVTTNGKNGIPASDTVRLTTSTTTVKPSTSTGSGVSLTYTVRYLAGDGTIPEGQKFKYDVARNGYVSGSPAVIAPAGKVFAGWSVDGVTLVSVEVYKITKDTTFKAIYVEKEEDTHRAFIVGYPGGEVRADAALTRAEAAAIIARNSDSFDPEKTYTANFTDVPADHWAYNYIAYVYESGIVTGYENGTFAPSSKINRAEYATIMQRYLGISLNEEATFTDVGKEHWAVAYIGACKDAGLINGYENGEFRPSNDITRAEAVKVLNRATDRIPTPASIDAYVAEKGVPFEDLDTTKWYYYEIMEAAFPHLISYYH